ncbi:MAG TPA: tRNA adenosine(34) deaminase TadA [Candidatus Dormibacteraeota bacterium]|nr:tRNA adenosine(34) deaminase TadA [Candidatus Dormibacteraeota bacterium]
MTTQAASEQDLELMRECLREAAAAEGEGEVPVGAVLVVGGRIVGRGHNRPIAAQDPTAHAEILALRAAGAALGNYRITEGELYVSVEPCLMCVGAIVHARLRRVVYGCPDPKGGALGGLFDATAVGRLNHRFAVTGGVLAEESQAILRRFFQARRGA